jgi:hypothetical protein
VPAKKDKPPSRRRQPVILFAEAKLGVASGLSAEARQGRQVWRWLDKPVGRRSSRDLIRIEAKRRLDADEVPPKLPLKKFANDLSAWLTENHFDAPPMSAGRVEKCVRDLWHAAGRGRR